MTGADRVTEVWERSRGSMLAKESSCAISRKGYTDRVGESLRRDVAFRNVL